MIQNTKLVIKRPIMLFMLCMCILSLQGLEAAQTLDRIVAIVNKDLISQSELDNYTRIMTAYMSKQARNDLPPSNILQGQMLNRMIQDKIQLQLAEQLGIEVDSISVSEAMQNIAKQQNESLESLKRKIEAQGLSFREYRNLIKNDLIIQHLQNKEVAQEITVSKADIESYLSSPAGQDHSGTEYKLSHILLALPEAPSAETLKRTKEQAEDLMRNLKNGADFNKMAMSKSTGRQALHGGDLGWRNVGELPTLFVTYVPTMKVGDIFGPIKSASGFHIIKLQDKRIPTELSRPSSEAALHKAHEILRLRKINEALDTWLQQIRNDASVEIFL